ncbi:MAG: tRNA pseudouridine(38-40) synthase TruA [Phycisphaerales bacterium]|nr:tRNA pseudouridine(38-40) synthase TruA [Phycisphaerales bacterium]
MNDEVLNQHRYKLTVAYDGTDFVGWQKQEPPDPDAPQPLPGQEPKRIQLRTVQHIVEQAVRETIREPAHVLGASRTDSGVHALGQVAAFTSAPDESKGVGWPIERGTAALVRALNSKLPRDVLIMKAETVPRNFNPIGGAIEKEYRYTMVSGPVRPLWDRRTVFHTWHPLDATLMQQAADYIVGEHDFACFAQIAHGRKTTVRTVFTCNVEPQPEPGRVVIRISGSGFLYNMVRIIAGTLMEVGRAKIDPDALPAILQSCDRKQAGPTLPPQGLRLEWIRYEEQAEKPG